MSANNTNQNSLSFGESRGGATLITIIGPSGAGKDTAARILSELTNIPVLVSYTTRPMREGEVNGREHHFVSECDAPRDTMLAYTQYGGYEYWTELSQIQGSAIYVIDEEGLRDLQENFPFINVITINLRASITVRRARGVSAERINRDDSRNMDTDIHYRFVVYNNYTLTRLKRQLGYIAYKIKQIIKEQNEDNT